MGTFVCIIVLAYSKRQQSQYWIPTLAISLVYYPFALVSPYNGGHAHVSPPPVNIAMRTPSSFSRISNTHRICDRNDSWETRVFYLRCRT